MIRLLSILGLFLFLTPSASLAQSIGQFQLQEQGDTISVEASLPNILKEAVEAFSKAVQFEGTQEEQLEQYIKQHFILYSSRAEPFNWTKTTLENKQDHIDTIVLKFSLVGKNLMRIENRILSKYKEHTNEHILVSGSKKRIFHTSHKRPVYIFPMKTAGAYLFPTSHPFWIVASIAAFIAIIFLAKRMRKT